MSQLQQIYISFIFFVKIIFIHLFILFRNQFIYCRLSTEWLQLLCEIIIDTTILYQVQKCLHVKIILYITLFTTTKRYFAQLDDVLPRQEINWQIEQLRLSYAPLQRIGGILLCTCQSIGRSIDKPCLINNQRSHCPRIF